MNLVANLVAFALLGAPVPGPAAPAHSAPSEKPATDVSGAPLFRFGFFAGFALDGTHFDVGGEWTSTKPFYVEVPLNPLCYVRVFVARNDAPEPDGDAVAAHPPN